MSRFDEESSQQESDILGYAMYCVLEHDKINVHVILPFGRTLGYIDDIRWSPQKHGKKLLCLMKYQNSMLLMKRTESRLLHGCCTDRM